MTRITCPWCGTQYATFQPNCSNCGGPLPFPETNSVQDPDERLPSPPPAPRSISDSYAWHLMMTEPSSIVALVFTILGSVFTILGIVLSVAINRVPVGVPFAIFGPVLLIVGLALGVTRYTNARQTVRVLREGQATEGEIVNVRENFAVTVNNRHPWIITYRFHQDGRDFQGQVRTLETPGPRLQAGKRSCVLFLPDAPQHNVLYPHP